MSTLPDELANLFQTVNLSDTIVTVLVKRWTDLSVAEQQSLTDAVRTVDDGIARVVLLLERFFSTKF